MSTSDADNPVLYSGSIQWAITLRPFVVIATGIVSAGLAVGITALFEWGRPVFDVVALGWGIWGTLLAITIYIVSTATAKTAIETSQDEMEAEKATEDVAALPFARMTTTELSRQLTENAEYVKAFRRKHPDVPREDIVYVGVAPREGNERNRARIIGTRANKEYSVFHGGRTGSWIVRRL